MLTETGRIVALDEHSLWVQTLPRGGCGKCAQGEACSCAMLGGGARPRARHLQLSRAQLEAECGTVSLQVGQRVEIGLEEGALLGGVFLMYVAPLLGLLGGSLTAYALWSSELASAVGGALGFAAGLAPAWMFNRRRQGGGGLQPRALRVWEVQAQPPQQGQQHTQQRIQPRSGIPLAERQESIP